MAEFNITVDARKLFYRKFEIPGRKNDIEKWLNAGEVRKIVLEPGTYGIMVPSCQAKVKFDVTSAGVVEYDQNLEGCLEGRGTSTLEINGLPVTVDARYVAMGGAKGLFLGAGEDEDWIVHRSIQLLPATGYHVQQGSALVSSFAFDLHLDERGAWRFDYKADYDLSRGGFLGGGGTSTLVFRGYPFLVDATAAAGDTGVNFFNVHGLPMAFNGVQFVNLLPMGSLFRLGVKGESGPLGFKVKEGGGIELTDGAVYRLVPDSFHGLTRLTFEKK